jgi:hemerythrin superfamily protein
LRGRLFGEIRRLVTMHFALEEDVLYPAVQNTGTERANAVLEQSRSSHELLRRLLTEMEQIDLSSPAFHAKMDLFRTNVEQYAVKEERALFAEVGSLSPELRGALRSQLHERREKWPGEQ